MRRTIELKSSMVAVVDNYQLLEIRPEWIMRSSQLRFVDYDAKLNYDYRYRSTLIQLHYDTRNLVFVHALIISICTKISMCVEKKNGIAIIIYHSLAKRCSQQFTFACGRRWIIVTRFLLNHHTNGGRHGLDSLVYQVHLKDIPINDDDRAHSVGSEKGSSREAFEIGLLFDI